MYARGGGGVSEAIIEREWTTGAGLRAIALIIVFENVKTGERYKNHRCGYVESPPALVGKDYDNINVRVHGGLTYAAPNNPGVVEDKSGSYWFGFDCAHAGDGDIERPSYLPGPSRGEAKTLEFVVAECESLAAQLVQLGARP